MGKYIYSGIGPTGGSLSNVWYFETLWYIVGTLKKVGIFFLPMYSLKKSSTKKFTLLQGSYFGQHGVHLVSLNVSGSIPRGSRCWVQLCSTIRCSTYLIPRVRTSVLSHPIPIPLILIAPQCNIHILDGFFLDPPGSVLLWVFWASYEPNDLYPIPFLFKAIWRKLNVLEEDPFKCVRWLGHQLAQA